ncbi:hypothetical protein ACQPXT_34310 [Streptomyces sp. CA-100214]
MQEAQSRHGKRAEGTHCPVGLLELCDRGLLGDHARHALARSARLAVADEHDIGGPRADRCGGMADMGEETAPTDRGPVQPTGADAQMVGHLYRRRTRGRETVDVREGQSRIHQRRERGFRVQTQHRLVGVAVDVRRLGRPNDRD